MEPEKLNIIQVKNIKTIWTTFLFSLKFYYEIFFVVVDFMDF